MPILKSFQFLKTKQTTIVSMINKTGAQWSAYLRQGPTALIHGYKPTKDASFFHQHPYIVPSEMKD